MNTEQQIKRVNVTVEQPSLFEETATADQAAQYKKRVLVAMMDFCARTKRRRVNGY